MLLNLKFWVISALQEQGLTENYQGNGMVGGQAAMAKITCLWCMEKTMSLLSCYRCFPKEVINEFKQQTSLAADT